MQIVCVFNWIKRQNVISGSRSGRREYPDPPGRYAVLTGK